VPSLNRAVTGPAMFGGLEVAICSPTLTRSVSEGKRASDASATHQVPIGGALADASG
jgi:hypothetical protein